MKLVNFSYFGFVIYYNYVTIFSVTLWFFRFTIVFNQKIPKIEYAPKKKNIFYVEINNKKLCTSSCNFIEEFRNALPKNKKHIDICDEFGNIFKTSIWTLMYKGLWKRINNEQSIILEKTYWKCYNNPGIPHKCTIYAYGTYHEISMKIIKKKLYLPNNISRIYVDEIENNDKRSKWLLKIREKINLNKEKFHNEWNSINDSIDERLVRIVNYIKMNPKMLSYAMNYINYECNIETNVFNEFRNNVITTIFGTDSGKIRKIIKGIKSTESIVSHFDTLSMIPTDLHKIYSK